MENPKEISLEFRELTFRFKRPAGTSRGTLYKRRSWFILARRHDQPEVTGIGECAPLEGLSPETSESVKNKLSEISEHPERFVTEGREVLNEFPSVRFGLETALSDLQNGGNHILFPSLFTEGNDAIPINGLIWMGDQSFMLEQISEKLNSGYRCIKLKIGAIGFEKEVELIQTVRKEWPAGQLEIRVDANGAFSCKEAPEKLKILSGLGIHSIEQPVRIGQWQEMAALCENSPVPVALDEELIPLHDIKEKKRLLETVRPQYIVLKPGLLGGFSSCLEWIQLAKKYHIGWWITSALESNIGLNAIAQWTYSLQSSVPQGLGTGQLFIDNIPSPLFIRDAHLYFNPGNKWDVSRLQK